MSVQNGNVADQNTFNSSFISREEDSSTVGKISLQNTDLVSGPDVVNIQRAINETFSAVGMTGEGDANANQYANNNVVVDGDSYKESIEKLDGEFNPVGGHNHDGVNSAAVSADNIIDFNKYFAEFQTFSKTGVSGSSVVITTEMSGKVAGGGVSTAGVPTVAPYNKAQIKSSSNGDFLEDASGNKVYARVTESAGVWTLSFYVFDAGAESSTSISSTDLDIYFVEVFDQELRPTFSADLGNIGSLDATNDVISATTGIQGKVLLSSTVASEVGSSSGSGTANGTVANADHTHKGVRSVSKSGDAALYGGVTVSGSGGTTLTQAAQNIDIVTPALASTSPANIGSAAVIGVGTTTARADHAHRGVHSVKKTGDIETYGDIELEPGSNITITRTSNKYTFASTGGGGGGGGFNYIDNSGAEVDTTGWSTFSTTFSGGLPQAIGAATGNVTFTRSTSNPLNGSASFAFAAASSAAIGDGVISDAEILNDEDLAKMLEWAFAYRVASGSTFLDFSGTSTQSLELWVYNVGLALWYQPAGFRGMNTKTGASVVKSQFQSDISDAGSNNQYRVALIVRNTISGAFTLQMDSLRFGPQSGNPTGPAMSDWVAYTPTTSWVTNATPTGSYRRVGDSAEFQVKVTINGLVTNTPLTVNLPSGLTIDTAKMASATAGVTWLGDGEAHDAGNNLFAAVVVYNSTTSIAVMHRSTTSGANPEPIDDSAAITASVPATWGSGDSINIKFKVPITGWSSNTQVSNDTDTRVVAARAGLTTSQTGITDKVIPFNSVAFDTHAAFNSSTGVYTVPVSGIYRVSASANLSSSGSPNDDSLHIRKNGATVKQQYGHSVTSGAGTFVVVEDLVSVVAGDTIDIYVDGDASFSIDNNSTRTTVAISRLSGPSQIAASEVVVFQANKAAGSHTNTGNEQEVGSWNAASFDTHGSFTPSSGRYTAPVSGFYRVSATIGFANNSTGARYFSITKNGTAIAYPDQRSATISSAATGVVLSGSAIVKLNAGEYISLFAFQDSGGNLAYLTSTSTVFSIERIGGVL